MKCYRVYFENEVVATVFSLAEVAAIMDMWTAAGYNTTFRKEDYETETEAAEEAEEQTAEEQTAEEQTAETETTVAAILEKVSADRVEKHESGGGVIWSAPADERAIQEMKTARFKLQKTETETILIIA